MFVRPGIHRDGVGVVLLPDSLTISSPAPLRSLLNAAIPPGRNFVPTIAVFIVTLAPNKYGILGYTYPVPRICVGEALDHFLTSGRPL